METSLAERLDLLNHKIDDLNVLFRHMERTVDDEWRGTARSAVVDRPLLAARGNASALATEFMAILERRNRIWADIALDGAASPWDADIQAEADKLIDPLWDRLFELAAGLAEQPAHSAADIRAKASALKELAEERSDDLVHRLAASLARDLLA